MTLYKTLLVRDFNALPEYSMGDPTGVVVGMVWRLFTDPWGRFGDQGVWYHRKVIKGPLALPTRILESSSEPGEEVIIENSIIRMAESDMIGENQKVPDKALQDIIDEHRENATGRCGASLRVEYGAVVCDAGSSVVALRLEDKWVAPTEDQRRAWLLTCKLKQRTPFYPNR